MKRTATHTTPLISIIAFLMMSGTSFALVPGANDYEDSAVQIDASDLVSRIINHNAQQLAEQRDAFVAAEQALRKGDRDTYKNLLPQLDDYPLLPYLHFHDLKQRLNKASMTELETFFTQYRELPIASQLRHKLLLQSAHQKQWQRFLSFYQPTRDRRIQCHYINALIQTRQEASANTEIEKLWLSGESQPRGCDKVFEHWRKNGQMTTDLVWQRFEMALDKHNRSLARYLIRFIPENQQSLARLWVKLDLKPSLLTRYQQQLQASSHPMAQMVYTKVMKRLAKKDPLYAAKSWEQLSHDHQIPLREKYAIQQSLAVSLARQHQAGAEDWFSRIPSDLLSSTAIEWRIRNALRYGNWQSALSSINSLPLDERDSDCWLYWQARALQELGNPLAESHFNELAQRRSFYGFLAADHLGLPYTLGHHPLEPSAGEFYLISRDPTVMRSHELYLLGRIVDARREWLQATGSMDNQQRITAAKLLQHWGWAEQSILTMATTDYRDDINLRFPLLYQDKVLEHAEQESIDPAWAFGVIRRESAFVEDARSPRGAVGLMQLMPATAKYLSRIKKIKAPNTNQLTQADTNLALGTYYLKRMLNRFDGQTVLATAAYNAGANRIMHWLPDDITLDAARWIETIPYQETRDYVTSVLAYTVIYAERLGIEGQRLSEHLKTIPSREDL